MTINRLIRMWQIAAEDLKLEIITPFTLILPSGAQVKAEFLLENFGAAKGMIIVRHYGQVAPFVDEIVSQGYGFSVLNEPAGNEKYVRGEFIEVLSDWGWSGENRTKPNWLQE